jgi:4-aminobutyrate aminotransferase-like enzyme
MKKRGKDFMAQLHGDELSTSSKVQKQIDDLVQSVTEISKKIKTVSPANADHAQKFKALADKINQNRGRPLYLPFIGSGIGHGSLVELEDGSVKLDLINGIGINLMGHSHPRVMAATVRGALQDIIVQGNLEPNKEYVEFGELMTSLAKKKSRLTHAWITTCGSMANEIALKISRQKRNPARKVISMKGAFAGRSTLMTEITDNPATKEGQPGYDEAIRIPFLDTKDPKSKDIALAEMKKMIDQNKGNISAFMFELVQGEGGFNVGTREYFVPLFELCKENNILIWADEVQTFARTGEMFAYEKLDLGNYLDFCTIAKTAQVGCTLFTAEMNPKPGLIAGTFAGATASLAAGTEIIKMLVNDNFLGPNGKIVKLHNEFTGMLENLAKTTLKGMLDDIGGIGLMIAAKPLDGSKGMIEKLVKALFENGLIGYYCGHGPYKLRFLIPATMTSEEVKLAGEIIEKSILQVAKG